MAMRIGLGPVFKYECIIAARRWQVYAARSLFVAALLASLTIVWGGKVEGKQLTSIKAQAEVGQFFFVAIVGTVLALVLLAAPASAAGAICLDKARGTLAHVMVTDLSDSEIVLGKLAARLLPVLGLLACCLPVMALGTLLGGIDPDALMGAFLVTLGCAVLGCALALWFSVWATKAFEVMLTMLTVGTVWILAYPGWTLLSLLGWLWGPPGWVGKTNPFWVALSPTVRPGMISFTDQVVFLVGSLIVSAVFAALSVVNLRFAAVRQASRPARVEQVSDRVASLTRRFREAFWPGPSLDGNPVLWREWQRTQPSRWARAVWLIYAAGSIAVTVSCLARILFNPGRTQVELIGALNGFQVSAGLLLLSASASTSLSEERVRGSLDVLLTTPLSTAEIIWGKWLGAFRTAPLLAILPGLLAMALAWHNGQNTVQPFVRVFVVIVGGALTILGLALARIGTRLGRNMRVCAIIYICIVLGCVFVASFMFKTSGVVHALLVVGLVLAYGAALTSLGLALATWVSHVGRAMALCVTGYVLMTVGWVFVIVLLLTKNQFAAKLLFGSPFFGVFFGSAGAGGRGPLSGAAAVGWMWFWILAYGAAALILLLATLATFDRSLGRMRERNTRPKRGPAPELVLRPAAALK